MFFASDFLFCRACPISHLQFALATCIGCEECSVKKIGLLWGWLRNEKRLPRVPGHALHEKGLQRQIGIGPLVRSQERRALAVPQVNHWLCSYIGLNGGFLNSCFPKKRCKIALFDALEGKRDCCFLGEPFNRRPVLPGTPAPARRATPRPDPPVVYPGFGFDKWFSRTCLYVK